MPRFPSPAPSAVGLSDRVFGQLVRKSGSKSESPKDTRLYPLHVGDTYLEPLPLARAEAQVTSSRAKLHTYSPVQGEPELLRAIADKVARRSGVQLDIENLQVMSGATAGLGVVCTALLDPGDEVILPAPFWPLIRGIIRSRGAKAVEVPLFTQLADPSFDAVAAIERAITPRTVAIYVNTPHNPTGAMLPERVLAGIAELAKRHDLWLLSDEVYEDVYFTPDAPPSVFARSDFQGRTISTHSVSKAYGLAGARVGFTHGPREIMEVIRGVQTFYSYCAPRPMQFGAAQALAEGDGWLDDMRRLYGSAGRASAEALGIPAPAGGTFLFFDLARYIGKNETLMTVLERCLDAGVMLTPGTACGQDFTTWARLCFTVLPENELREALDKLRGALGIKA
ncbi:MAG TPA: pyridoxal phosphate-dependent aminotransferase [Polyangiales bacterium]|nr:pyridoxal phosphate-dependent aminotransferase [Polyangiales bacterium]